MDRKSVAQPRAGAITVLAERQYGVIAVAQLYSLGLSETQVATRVANGWLHRVHRGIYALGHRRLTSEARWMAAVLACGEGTLLSHQAAAELWKLRQRRQPGESPIDVIVPRASGRQRRPGIVVHRVTGLLPEEATSHCRIPVTSPARTILDLGSTLPRRQLERAMDEAERLKLCTEEELDVIIRAHFGRPGAGVLRALLHEHRAGSTATRSALEEGFLALCRKYRLPQPEVNVPLLDYVVDFLWRDAALIVEVDGHASHGTRRAFQADRDRDGRLAVAGFAVLRFTWWDVMRRPAVVADRVRRMLL
jgi:very-short-patch-repair endonuclease